MAGDVRISSDDIDVVVPASLQFRRRVATVRLERHAQPTQSVGRRPVNHDDSETKARASRSWQPGKPGPVLRHTRRTLGQLDGHAACVYKAAFRQCRQKRLAVTECLRPARLRFGFRGFRRLARASETATAAAKIHVVVDSDHVPDKGAHRLSTCAQRTGTTAYRWTEGIAGTSESRKVFTWRWTVLEPLSSTAVVVAVACAVSDEQLLRPRWQRQRWPLLYTASQGPGERRWRRAAGGEWTRLHCGGHELTRSVGV